MGWRQGIQLQPIRCSAERNNGDKEQEDTLHIAEVLHNADIDTDRCRQHRKQPQAQAQADKRTVPCGRAWCGCGRKRALEGL